MINQTILWSSTFDMFYVIVMTSWNTMELPFFRSNRVFHHFTGGKYLTMFYPKVSHLHRPRFWRILGTPSHINLAVFHVAFNKTCCNESTYWSRWNKETAEYFLDQENSGKLPSSEWFNFCCSVHLITIPLGVGGVTSPWRWRCVARRKLLRHCSDMVQEAMYI